jgi:type II secretory pathway pseudopilin PulG
MKPIPSITHHRTRSAGFSLVEVALALMVVSIGLLSLVGLLPVSLDMSRKSIEDSQLGLFGDNMMNGYRATLQIRPWSEWDTLNIRGTAEDVWDNPQKVGFRFGSGDASGTNIYKYTSNQPSGGSVEIVDLAARYEFTVKVQPFDNRLISCNLELLPGEFGPTNSLHFYTEIYSTDLTW